MKPKGLVLTRAEFDCIVEDAECGHCDYEEADGSLVNICDKTARRIANAVCEKFYAVAPSEGVNR